MTGASAVFHVLRYDTARLRWWWLVYLALVSAASAAPVWARTTPSDSAPLLGFMPMLLPLVGMLFALALTSGDSAFDPQAFMNNKPLRATERFVAKLVSIVLVAGVTALAITLGLVQAGLDTTTGAAIALTAIAPYSLALVSTSNIGAQARRFSVGVLSLLAAVVLLMPLSVLRNGVRLRDPGALWLWAVAVGLLWLMYTRRVSWRTAVAASVALVTLSISGWCSGNFPRESRLAGRATPLAERVQFGALPDSIGEYNNIPFTLSDARSDRLYYALTADVVPSGEVRMRDDILVGAGRNVTANLPEVSANMFPDLAGLDWQTTQRRPSPRVGMGVLSGDLRADAQLKRVRQIRLSATVARFRAERLLIAPLLVGELGSRAGRRFVVVEDRGEIKLEAREAPRKDGPSWIPGMSDPSQRFDVVVIDSVANKAHWLPQSGLAGSDALYVLPTVSFSVMRMQFRDQPLLRSLLERKHGTSIIVYRWVEEGRTTAEESREVTDWPIGSSSSISVGTSASGTISAFSSTIEAR